MSVSHPSTVVAVPGRREQLDAVLDRLADAIPGVAHVVAVSSDGLRTATTRDLDIDRGDQLAAIVSGLVSLGRSATGLLETKGLRYQLVSMVDGTLVVQMTRDGSALAALAHPDCDWGQVAYELAALAASIGDAVTPPPRPTG
jgi:uncharacterized protein